MTKQTTANLGFEKKLWAAADKMRNNMDPAEYKHVVLGLIFLKYISDSFEDTYQSIKADKDAYEGEWEDKDAYKARNVFWVPEKARWDYLKQNAKKPEIGKLVDDAMIAIEKDNPTLKGVLPKRFARPDLNKQRLGEIIDIFSSLGLGDKEAKAKDILGRVYEYFIGRFASAEGKGGGEFYTPASVVKLLVQMIEPYKGRVYDPCCGSGGMFVQSEKFVEEHGGKTGDISVYGQESNPTTWRLCIMNMAIRGIEGNIAYGNTYDNDLHPDLKADFILANPPFNDSDWGGEKLKDDMRWKYGTPPTGNANYAWIQHFIHHLSPSGIAGFVMHGGASSNKGAEQKIRQSIVDAGLVDCVVHLPTQLFFNVSLPVDIWIISRPNSIFKNRKRNKEILFIDVSNIGFMEDSTHRALSQEDINNVVSIFHDWIEDKTYKDKRGVCRSVSITEVQKRDYSLSPNRYQATTLEFIDNQDDRNLKKIIELFNVNFEQMLKSISKRNHNIKFNGLYDEYLELIKKSSLSSNWGSHKINEVILSVDSGEWGYDIEKDGYEKCRVIRGTDMPNIFMFNVHKVPIRYIKKEKIHDKSLKGGELVVEISGGSKDQPTGRCLLINDEILEFFHKPILYSNFTKAIKVKTDIVSPSWFYLCWSFLYKNNVTTKYENQPSGIKNFQLDEFIEYEEILIPSSNFKDEFYLFIEKLLKIRNRTNVLLQKMDSFINLTSNDFYKTGYVKK